MANSSAIQLADLALVWLTDDATGSADLELIDNDLASDRGLVTAVILSLFTDRRAQDDDAPPSGDPNDRRGWWGDEFAAVEGDLIGSRLWLLSRSVLTNETVLLAKQYCDEALKWMLDDKVVASIPVVITRIGSALLIAVSPQRLGRDPVTFQFAWVWDHVQEDL